MDIGKKPTLFIDKNVLLSKISSLEIFQRYCSNFIKVNVLFVSELRADNRKTCNIYFDKEVNDYMYHDFADKKLSAIDYVKEKYNLSFNDTLHLIANSFNIDLDSKKTSVNKELIREDFQILIQERDFNNYDVKYWNQFGVSINDLKLEDIKAVDKFWYGYNNSLQINVCSKIFGTYSYEHGNNKRDIYTPHKKESGKWFKNSSHSIYGINKLDSEGPLLLIATSQKDRLCLKYALGYKNVIAATNESATIHKPIIQDLKSRFKKIVIVPDWDSPGLKQAVIKAYLYDCSYTKICIKLKEDTKCKDVAELYSTNPILCREIINQEINKLI